MSPKSQHHRRASKGSRSLFSGALWRSIGRARSRSTLDGTDTDLDLRSASAFQCDPSRQTPSSENLDAGNNRTPSFHTSASTSLKTLYLRSVTRSSLTATEEHSHRTKPRPLSWFSFTRQKTPNPDSGGRTTFVQPSDMPSTSHSRISTPVLTSTTNARIADSEDVEYTDILLPDYSSRDVLFSGRNQETSLAHHVQHSIVHPSTWSSTVRSMKHKLAHRRRASTSVLSETPWSRRVAEIRSRNDGQNTQLVHSFHTYKDILHRNRQERGSPGNDLEHDTPAQGDVTSLSYSTRNKSTPDFHLPPRLPGLYSESNTDLLAPSLTKSFAIAIDKLDFNSSPTLLSDGTPVSKLKKAKSYLSLHRLVREYSDRTLDKNDVVVSSSPVVLVSKTKNARNSTEQPITDGGRDDIYKPKIRASKPIQLRFSGQKKRYVPSKPDTNSPGGVNPLRMHPEVGNATSSSGQVTPATPSVLEDVDEHRAGSLDRAIIYSPSTGNLSVYSRTPSPRVQTILPKERIPQDTPTRRPLRKASGSMLRKSVSTFFGRSASMIKVANLTPSKRPPSEKDIARTHRHRTTSESRLLDSKAIPDLRARSMSTPEMHKVETARAPWDYQPSTPSPLRESTMVSSNVKGRQRAATSVTPIRPTVGIMLDKARSNSILSDPQKRYGRYIDQADAPNVVTC